MSSYVMKKVFGRLLKVKRVLEYAREHVYCFNLTPSSDKTTGLLTYKGRGQPCKCRKTCELSVKHLDSEPHIRQCSGTTSFGRHWAVLPRLLWPDRFANWITCSQKNIAPTSTFNRVFPSLSLLRLMFHHERESHERPISPI
jgi:hypothetical protein